ncbi:MAG: hypothetical protein PHE55_15745 [Methylococcaceae bacterium]|nr:hypothetical protein [Methylococcaceae bacterium]
MEHQLKPNLPIPRKSGLKLAYFTAIMTVLGAADEATASPDRKDKVNAYCAARKVTVTCANCHLDLTTNLLTPTAGQTAYKANNFDYFCPAPAPTPTPVTTNDPPVLTLTPSGNQAVTEGTAAKPISVAVSDPNKDPVTLAVTPNPLPAGASWDSSAKVLSYTPPTGTSVGTPAVTFTFTATDAPSNGSKPLTVSQNVTFSVSAQGTAPNDPPQVTAPASVNTTVGDGSFTFEVQASDPNGDPLTLTATNLPAGLNFTDTKTQDGAGHWIGKFSWAPKGPDAGLASATPYVVTVTAKDDHNAQSAKDVKIFVNPAPATGTPTIGKLTISRAYWLQRRSTLFASGLVKAAKGTKLRGLPVTLSDVGTGAILGTTSLSARGTWSFSKPLTGLPAPCSIRIEAGGISAMAEVDRAPSSCGQSDSQGGISNDSHSSSSDASKNGSTGADSHRGSTTPGKTGSSTGANPQSSSGIPGKTGSTSDDSRGNSSPPGKPTSIGVDPQSNSGAGSTGIDPQNGSSIPGKPASTSSGPQTGSTPIPGKTGTISGDSHGDSNTPGKTGSTGDDSHGGSHDSDKDKSSGKSKSKENKDKEHDD